VYDLPHLNLLLHVAVLDEAVHKDAGHVDVVLVKVARGHNLLHLGDGDLCRARHGLVEVAGGLAEDEVAGRVGLVGTDKGIVAGDGLLHDVVDAVELAALARLAGNLDRLAALGKLDGNATRLAH
jgi:hypothetical protein